MEKVEKKSDQIEDNTFKQRLVGAVVLVSLAVIFLPMIFDKQNELADSTHELVVVAVKPTVSQPPQHQIQEVELATPIELEQPELAEQPAEQPAPTPEPKPAPKPVAAKPKPIANPKPGIDANNLPVSWSIQVASGSNLQAALSMRDAYRKQGYKAYVRSEKKLHKVLLGPYIRSADAQQECNKIKQQKKDQKACFVVRFQPVN